LLEQAVAELDVLISKQDTRLVQTDDAGWPILGQDDQS
jgi:hypothetical protein